LDGSQDASTMTGSSGVALIEALIATAIVSGIGVAVVLLLDANRLTNARATGQLRHTLSAQAILDRVGLDVPLRVQRSSGRLRDGSGWSIDIVPYQEPDLSASSGQSRLLRVTVRILPEEGKGIPVELQTLMLLSVMP
jgi:hypothetical protein